MQFEQRCQALQMTRVSLDASVRAKTGKGSRTLVGHAAIFNTDADIGGSYLERIRPGAFARVLRSPDLDVRGLVEHQGGLMTIARSTNGSLRLAEDRIGLAVEIDVAKTREGDSLLELVRTGRLDQMSFGFAVSPEGEHWTRENGRTVREIIEVDALADVSVVAFGAYEQTDVSVA